MQTKSGYIVSPSLIGSQSYNIGFEPDFVVFYYSNMQEGLNEGFGVACKTTSVKQYGRCSCTKNHTGYGTQSEVSAILRNNTVEASLSEFNSTGFTLNWITTEVGFEVNYWAVSGVQSCELIKISSPTVPSSVSHSGIGFQPKAILAFSGNNGRCIRSSQGFASSTNQQFAVGFAYPNSTCFQSFESLLKTFQAGVLDMCVSLKSFDSDGFTLSWSEIPVVSQDIFLLVMSGAYFEVGKDKLPTVIGEAMSSTNLQPSTIFIGGSSDNCVFLGSADNFGNQRASASYLTEGLENGGTGSSILLQLESPTNFASTSVSFSNSDTTGYRINQTAKHVLDQEYGYFVISDSPRKSYSRLASRPDFERGELYDNYRRYPFFAERAQIISQNCFGKILIVGCGWGFTVDECLSLGLDAWGCDASSYAVFKAQKELPQTSYSRIVVGNILSSSDISNIKLLSGLTIEQKFDWCVTDDVLPVLNNDSEVLAALAVLRSHANNLLHFITPKIDGTQHESLMWKTASEWRNFLDDDLMII